MGIVIKNTVTYIKVKLLVNNVFSLRKTISQKTSSKKLKSWQTKEHHAQLKYQCYIEKESHNI